MTDIIVNREERFNNLKRIRCSHAIVSHMNGAPNSQCYWEGQFDAIFDILNLPLDELEETKRLTFNPRKVRR
jgi:hypothetical protein